MNHHTSGARPNRATYRFTPLAHETATVAGLSRTYSAEEIGAIYAANWERDFSRGHAELVSAALAWTAVKNHVAQRNGDLAPPAASFQSAAWKVVDNDLIDIIGGQSLGRYQTWEHMDAPDDHRVRDAADERWGGKAGGLVGYLMDSRAYIKDQMVAAIDVYRVLHNSEAIGRSIDNWNGVAKPKGYVDPVVVDAGEGCGTHLPSHHDDNNVASRAPITEHTVALAEAQTADQVEACAATANAVHRPAHWDLVAQHLGRGMHAFEDFWAHSNWLDLAKLSDLRARRDDNVVPVLPSRAVANQDLHTATFDMSVRARALGHEVLALAREFQRDFDLLLNIYNRTEASTKLHDEDAMLKRSTAWGSDGDSDHAMAFAPLEADCWSAIDELVDLFIAVRNVQELVRSGRYKVDDFLCNRAWLAALENKSKIVIDHAYDDSTAGSRARLAKGQDEVSPDDGGRILIAQAANEFVFGPLRAIMDENNTAKALAAILEQLSLVDTMLQAPSSSHPLWSHVAALVEAP